MTRAIIIVLLLLAVSPVTAPFLTLNAGDLLGHETPIDVAVVQSKKGYDQPVTALPGTVALPLLPVGVEDLSAAGGVLARTRKPVHVPLRI